MKLPSPHRVRLAVACAAHIGLAVFLVGAFSLPHHFLHGPRLAGHRPSAVSWLFDHPSKPGLAIAGTLIAVAAADDLLRWREARAPRALAGPRSWPFLTGAGVLVAWLALFWSLDGVDVLDARWGGYLPTLRDAGEPPLALAAMIALDELVVVSAILVWALMAQIALPRLCARSVAARILPVLVPVLALAVHLEPAWQGGIGSPAGRFDLLNSPWTIAILAAVAITETRAASRALGSSSEPVGAALSLAWGYAMILAVANLNDPCRHEDDEPLRDLVPGAIVVIGLLAVLWRILTHRAAARTGHRPGCLREP